MTANEYLAELAKTGWVTGFSDDDVSQLLKRVDTFIRHSPSCPAWGIPAASYDPQAALRPDFGQYMLDLYRQASGGRFTPEQIVYERPPRSSSSVRLVFHYAGRAYDRRFSWEMEEPFKAIRDMANAAVSDAGLQQRFYEVPRADDVGIVFVAPGAHSAATARGLLQQPW